MESINQNTNKPSISESFNLKDWEILKPETVRYLEYLSVFLSILFSIAWILYFVNKVYPLVPVWVNTNINDTQIRVYNENTNQSSLFEKNLSDLVLGDCFIDGNITDTTKRQVNYIIDNYAKQWCFYSVNHKNYINLLLVPLIHQSWSTLSSNGRIWINLTKLEKEWGRSLEDYFKDTSKELDLQDPHKNCIIITRGTEDMISWWREVEWIPLKEQDIFAWLFINCELIEDSSIQRWKDFLKIIELRGYKTVEYNWYDSHATIETKQGKAFFEISNLTWSVPVLVLNSFDNNMLWEFLIDGQYKKETSLYLLTQYFNPEKYSINKYCIVKQSNYNIITFNECYLTDVSSWNKIELSEIK